MFLPTFSRSPRRWPGWRSTAGCNPFCSHFLLSSLLPPLLLTRRASFTTHHDARRVMTRRAWFSVSSCKKSNTKYSCLETPGRTDLFVIFGRFFEKSWIFHAETYIFGILYVSNILMLKRMREGLLLYRLLDRVWYIDSLTFGGSKNDKNVKKLWSV